MIYSCCNELRKNAILGSPAITLNGIDYLEVPDQQTLRVYCLKPLPVPFAFTPANVTIEGGESITAIAVASVAQATDAANVLVVKTNRPGDFSTYVLRLVNSAAQAAGDPFDVTEVLTGFDPQLAQVQFSFKVECGPDFDCGAPPAVCSQTQPPAPPINYLAKDYGSFRTLILDRLNQLLPAWGGVSEADLGIALAELIASQADYLSYRQDAIATEAYLETARSRVSLRRHALLVDYHVHDGCNARTWIQLQVAGNPGEEVFLDHSRTRFYSYAPGMPSNLAVAGNEEAALLSGVQVFEPMQDALLYPEHNQMLFYTWGDTGCCLPKGALEATLNGSYPNLQPGDLLIFQTMIGAQTGNPADADLRHRCAVRLTQVATQDANGHPLVDPLFDHTGNAITNPATQTPAPVTEIQWSQDDALPFPVCISSEYLDSNGDRQTVTSVSVAFGNVVLADHGLSISGKTLGTVPEPKLYYPTSTAADHCQPTAPSPLPVRFRPAIPDSPLTQAVPLPLAGSPVTSSVVLLAGTGSVNLTDSNGFVCLTVQAVNSFAWPQFFGVTVRQNQTTPANFDLAVTYNPSGGAAGIQTEVTLENLTNLSLKPTDPNYVAIRINALSRLIQVPSSYVPPTAAPAGFAATPTMLPNTGTVTLSDLSNPAVAYLTLQPTSPAGWLPAFGVLAQGNQREPSVFNLAVVYDPPSGGVGVTLPVTVEQFTNVSLATIADQFTSGSTLVAVKSFAQAPNPGLSAYDLMNFDPSEAVPVIALKGTLDGTFPWSPEQDLLGSAESDRDFVVEVESDGTATLRFATPSDPGSAPDNSNGMIPDSGTVFVAGYRVGNGTAGNVGAESLVYLAASDARIQSCINPLPATGGTDPETNDQIRRRAPQAFLTQERSVIMTDYEAIAETNPQVDQAVASLRWTGSWYSVFIAVEPAGGGNLTSTLQKTLQASVERYRLAGQDLKLESPQYVSLQITLQVCVDPDYFQSDVEQSLMQVLGSRILPNGQKGLFYPDNFTFGQSVYLSPVYAAARSVPGVILVTATQFQPQGVNSTQYLSAGRIKLGSLQVARLDNDPSYPDHGQLILLMQGGK
jgi:hypothetical protein